MFTNMFDLNAQRLEYKICTPTLSDCRYQLLIDKSQPALENVFPRAFEIRQIRKQPAVVVSTHLPELLKLILQ
jgi:hypothetical protein